MVFQLIVAAFHRWIVPDGVRTGMCVPPSFLFAA
jgi:hypothetical protein